jgi:hypothetical protein
MAGSIHRRTDTPACHALGADSGAAAADPPAAHSDDRRQGEQKTDPVVEDQRRVRPALANLGLLGGAIPRVTSAVHLKAFGA